MMELITTETDRLTIQEIQDVLLLLIHPKEIQMVMNATTDKMMMVTEISTILLIQDVPAQLTIQRPTLFVQTELIMMVMDRQTSLVTQDVYLQLILRSAIQMVLNATTDKMMMVTEISTILLIQDAQDQRILPKTTPLPRHVMDEQQTFM